MLNAIIGNIVKDFRIEFRRRFAVNIALSFAAITTLAVSLTAGGVLLGAQTQAMLFWIILFFSAMNGLAHVFTREEEEGTALFLRVTSPAAAVYTAKLVFNTAVIFIIAAVISPLYVFFLNVDIAAPAAFAAATCAGSLAIASSTTVLAAIVARAGGRGSLFTIISFPVVLPPLWVAVGATRTSIAGSASAEGVVFLLAFSGALVAVSYMLFGHIWIEE
ncbi:MAG TPA: heme exporter protein CcmB [Spirochaetota bacterium]|nr:heme exporter protein CcmB [Spirochaetota bacterium]